MNPIINILNKDKLSKEDIVQLLSLTEKDEIEIIRQKAIETMLQYTGDKINLRGLIEFSNICRCNCFYCGIRENNENIDRYILSKAEILQQAILSARLGFGSIVLQSGEMQNERFAGFVADIIRRIKNETTSRKLPDGLGITLCCGEQKEDVYQEWFDAGAHRYLLRIESSNKELFSKLHPDEQTYESRIESLKKLKNIGYQTGTGVIIGIPRQSLEQLTSDVLFFKNMDVDMIGMGPYIPHHDTPMDFYIEEWEQRKEEIFKMSLKMIAVTRIFLKDVNIASTTALESISQYGREAGLQFGANVLMPMMTPTNRRESYKLYENKKLEDYISKDIHAFQIKMYDNYERIVNFEDWGDAPHYFNK